MLRLRKGLREPRTFSSGWFWAKTQPPTFKEERKEDQGGSWPPDWPQCKSQGSTFQQQQQIIREAKKHESQSHAREHKKQRESAPRRPSLLEPPACSVSVGLATVLCLSVLGASELRRYLPFSVWPTSLIPQLIHVVTSGQITFIFYEWILFCVYVLATLLSPFNHQWKLGPVP